MLILASSAAAEKNQLNFNFIHNLKRNRLTNERAFKLVSIYSYFRTLRKPNQKIEINIQDITNDIDFNNDMYLSVSSDENNEINSEIEE